MDYMFTCKHCQLRVYHALQWGLAQFVFTCPACGQVDNAIAEHIDFKQLPIEEQLCRLRSITEGYKAA